MNCRSFIRFLGAFADDELDTEKNIEALEHLNMCAHCAAKVAEIQLLKRSLTRVFSGERASDRLRERVRDAIADESSRRVRRFPQPRRWVVPLGMAAAIAFVWLGYPFVADRGTTPSATPEPALEARLVSSVVDRHFGCIKLGPAHHRASLPRDVHRIAEVLGRELGFPVCAPDLSKAGFRLHSADSCGADGLPGGHVVYERIADGVLLSVFSLRRTDAPPDAAAAPDPGVRKCLVCDQKLPAAVVGWRDARATYLLCAKLPPAELIALANGIE